jgi:nicotinate-nucleotide pyrophosphorylase (carboxylating)
MVLVKNNHIDAHPGGIRGALGGIVSKKPLYMPWEVEVRSMEELTITLEYHPTVIMLDNFSDEDVSSALAVIQRLDRRPLIEVSGGISQARLSRLAALGVDAVSVGRLTTRAPNVDISLRIS